MPISEGFEQNFYDPFAYQWYQQGYLSAEEVWNDYGGAYFDYEQFYGVKEDTINERIDTSIAGMNKLLASDLERSNASLNAKSTINDTIKEHKIAKIESKQNFNNNMYQNKKQSLLLKSLDSLTALDGQRAKSNLVGGNLNNIVKSAESIIQDKISQGAQAHNWQQSKSLDSISDIITKTERNKLADEAINAANYDLKYNDVLNRANQIELRGAQKIEDLKADYLEEQYNIVGSIFSGGPEGPWGTPDLGDPNVDEEQEEQEVYNCYDVVSGEPCDCNDTGNPYCTAQVPGDGGNQDEPCPPGTTFDGTECVIDTGLPEGPELGDWWSCINSGCDWENNSCQCG